MGALNNQRVLERLNDQFPGIVQSPEEPWGLLTVNTTKEKILEVIQFLYDDEELQFSFLTTLCGIHFPDRESEKFEVVYHLHSLVNNVRLRIKVRIGGAIPTIPTLTNIFSAANWMERETYDFYGIIFEGHPNLVRILNVDEMTIFPMRKEYPLEDNTRVDKNDSMFGRPQHVMKESIDE